MFAEVIGYRKDKYQYEQQCALFARVKGVPSGAPTDLDFRLQD
jgi:hypothetical protein